jgi:RNA polymerase sigma-70 factor, ECF subfamily
LNNFIGLSAARLVDGGVQHGKAAAMNPISTTVEQQNFADCIALHLPFLNRVVRRLMHGDEMAEDVVQQTVLKALMHVDQFRFESTLKTWLTSIAINEVYQAYRFAGRRRAISLTTETFEMDRCQRLDFPKNTYEIRERELLVRKAVSRLPEMYRSVVELCDLQCLPMKEAALKLGLTLPAIKTRRHRARQKLQRLVANLFACARDACSG